MSSSFLHMRALSLPVLHSLATTPHPTLRCLSSVVGYGLVSTSLPLLQRPKEPTSACFFKESEFCLRKHPALSIHLSSTRTRRLATQRSRKFTNNHIAATLFAEFPELLCPTIFDLSSMLISIFCAIGIGEATVEMLVDDCEICACTHIWAVLLCMPCICNEQRNVGAKPSQVGQGRVVPVWKPGLVVGFIE